MWHDDFLVTYHAWRAGIGRKVECWWPLAGTAFGIAGALAVGFGYPRKVDRVVSQRVGCRCCRRSCAADDTLRLVVALLVELE